MTYNFNYILFFLWLLIYLINIFYYCDYVTITHIVPLYPDWSTEKY